MITLFQFTHFHLSFLQVFYRPVNANAGENKIAFDLNGIASGIYFVNVKGANQAFTKKLIIE